MITEAEAERMLWDSIVKRARDSPPGTAGLYPESEVWKKMVRNNYTQIKWNLRKSTRATRALAKKLLKNQPEIEI